MPRLAQDVRLNTRNSRQKLVSRREPYWRSLVQGLALGYRRGTLGGTWIARANAKSLGRKHQALGAADDGAVSDGVAVLSFAEAQERARAWHAGLVREAAGLEPLSAGPYSVGQALDDYLADYRRRGGKALKETTASIEGHIRPALGSLPIASLSMQRLRGWHLGLAEAPARLRSKAGEPPKERPKQAADQDLPRQRRSTANRILTVLKASLNHAFQNGKAPSDVAWRRVTPFKGVEAPVVRYLNTLECRRLVNASADGFRPLVLAAILTGCRYSELARLQVTDFNAGAGKLLVQTSKAGKPRHVTLTEEGQRLLAQAAFGKAGDALLFPRADGKPWSKNHQQRPLAEACQRGGITPAISFHVLRHTHGSALAMQGVPLPVIAAQLGHADTRVTERHYAHLSPSYVADTIRAKFPDLGVVPSSNVSPLPVSTAV